MLTGKRVLVTGGTGSLGQTLVRRLLTGEIGSPKKITVFSRDEAKQHAMRLAFLQRRSATDDIIYRSSRDLVAFVIGDIRDYASVQQAVHDSDVIINAAALKQVPTCEYFPYQAVQTNVLGPENIVRAVCSSPSPVETVVAVSTDKACKPVNVMGMTKAIQERILLQANMKCPQTRFVAVRYGNVIASRGSVVPLFLEQIAQGGPVTITTPAMTRFLLSLDQAVDTVFAALRGASAGETYVPIPAAARIVDVARAMMNGRPVPIVFTGVRPGEKIHEILVSEEEYSRTILRCGYYVIGSVLPELIQVPVAEGALHSEYSSAAVTVDGKELRDLLRPYLTEEEPHLRAA